EALADVAQPPSQQERDDHEGKADRWAWDRRTGNPAWPDAARRDAFVELARGRSEVVLPNQLVHGDLFGNVLFAGSAPPAVVGFSPLWRPASYAAALVVLDAVAWGGAAPDLALRWQHRQQWGEMLRRAALARLALAATHPRSGAAATAGIVHAAASLAPFMD